MNIFLFLGLCLIFISCYVVQAIGYYKLTGKIGNSEQPPSIWISILLWPVFLFADGLQKDFDDYPDKNP